MVGQPKLPQVQLSPDELATHIEKAVLEEVSSGRITLPAMPKVAARLVHLANSVAFATFCKLESVQACVTRLGTRELSFFLMETAAKQLVECHDPRIAQICDGLWEHSLAVAILSHDLVEAVPGMDAEAAYLAGLLHDIGRPLVAEMLLAAEGRLLGKRIDHWIMPSKWLGIIIRCERTVGLAVTRAWTLPDSVTDAVGMCDQYDSNRPFRLANVVRMANALAEVSGHDLTAQPNDEAEMRIQEGREMLSLDADTVAGVMAGLPAKLAGRMV